MATLYLRIVWYWGSSSDTQVSCQLLYGTGALLLIPRYHANYCLILGLFALQPGIMPVIACYWDFSPYSRVPCQLLSGTGALHLIARYNVPNIITANTKHLQANGITKDDLQQFVQDKRSGRQTPRTFKSKRKTKDTTLPFKQFELNLNLSFVCYRESNIQFEIHTPYIFQKCSV